MFQTFRMKPRGEDLTKLTDWFHFHDLRHRRTVFSTIFSTVFLNNRD